MELVYLWVEEYKNIHQQGFNFSPRLKCHYDEASKELTIDENKEYVSIFPENINVTAIVGENGSGKSSLIRFIRLLLKHFSGEYIKTPIWMMLFYDVTVDKFYCLTHQHIDTLGIEGEYTNKVIIYAYDTSIDKNKYQDIPFLEQIIFPLLDYSLSYDNSISLRNFYQKPQSNRFLDFPNKSEKIIYLYDEHIETIRKIFQNFKELNEKNQWKIFEDFFHPRDISISFNMERFKSLGTGQSNNIAVSKYLRTVNETENKIGLEFIQLLYSEWNETKNLSSQQLKRLEIFRKLDNKTYFNMFDNLCQKNHSKMIKKESLGTRNSYDIFQFELSNICKDEVDYLLQLSLSEIFTIDIIDENSKKFNELSFGEQQLLKILNIIYYLSTNNEDKKLLIFLDEIDIGFHPNWQKRVIQYILKLLTSLSPKKFNLLISSHSPFLLSDIPKENVIFLEKGKQVYPFGDNQQTFGANIHTLLSHGFFMRDGLMGEFAKSKINKIMRFLSGKNKFIDFPIKDIKKVIELIGEPFLKEKLLFMYNEKYPKTNEEKIVELEAEITRLKNGQNQI